MKVHVTALQIAKRDEGVLREAQSERRQASSLEKILSSRFGVPTYPVLMLHQRHPVDSKMASFRGGRRKCICKLLGRWKTELRADYSVKFLIQSILGVNSFDCVA